MREWTLKMLGHTTKGRIFLYIHLATMFLTKIKNMMNNHMIIMTTKVWFTCINLSVHLNREALTLIFKPLNTGALSKQLTALYSCSLVYIYKGTHVMLDSKHIMCKMFKLIRISFRGQTLAMR